MNPYIEIWRRNAHYFEFLTHPKSLLEFIGFWLAIGYIVVMIQIIIVKLFWKDQLLKELKIQKLRKLAKNIMVIILACLVGKRFC